MHVSTIALTAFAGAAICQLFVPFGPYSGRFKAASTISSENHADIAVHESQRPLRGHDRKPKFSPADLPAYRHGQYALVEQDGAVCPTYGEKQWTGTIDVTDTRRLFFWAFESRNDPANDPVIFWMNGGPGGSSMTGAFTEMGACMFRNGSKIPEPNPWSWNNNATVVFLDQPASVGFSSIAEGGKLPTKDIDGAEDFQEFLNILFRDVFPDKAHLPIHIAAESYGGHYGPTYVHHILESRKYGAPTAFWGNITSMILIDAVLDFGGPVTGSYELFCKDERAAGIITEEQCEKMLAALPNHEKLSRQCEQSLDAGVCGALVASANENIMIYYDKLVEKGERNPYHVHRPCLAHPFCPNPEMGNFTEYLNRKQVKEALKFPESFTYHDINLDLNSAYVESGSAWVPTTPKVADILDAYKTPKFVDDGKSVGDVRIMALNGNLDSGINTHGNIIQYERIVWSRMGEYRIADWQDLEEGEVKGTGSWKGTKDGRLVFMAVDDAGHMVPGDAPEASYHILQRWLHNEWR
ncbi:carboxypeptidase Y [Cordyceps javanica]|uniref:Carboxypeptidase n=1 Tax=Cordyceps javanica TaxID=43265 RepID=A0A545W4S1_9HYPO|nr:carboxypeptidase Y [Cordyceps javanica]TQW08999.1 carboxypeptidase Y [Cordyceps javanica]